MIDASSLFNLGVGVASGILTPLLIQAVPGDLGDASAVNKLLIYGLGSILITFITTRVLGAMTKMADAPSKEEWKALFKTVAGLDKKVDTHLARYEEWQKNMERRMSDEEDK